MDLFRVGCQKEWFSSIDDYFNALDNEAYPWGLKEGIANLVKCIKPTIWELWSTHIFYEPRDRPEVYEYIPQQVLSNRLVYLALIRTIEIDRVEPCYEHDWDVNLSVILQGQKQPSASFKKNKQFLLYALSAMRRTDPPGQWPLQSICGELLSDRDIVIAAIEIDGLFLKHVPDELRGDREVVLAAVKDCWLALEYAADELKNDADLVLYAIEQNTYSLNFASEALKTNWDFMQRAIKRNKKILCRTPLHRDREFMLKILQDSPELLEYATPGLRASKVFVLEALQRGIKLEQSDYHCVCKNRPLMLALMEKNGNIRKLVPSDSKNDPEMVLAAVRQSPEALQFASPAIQDLCRLVSEGLK